MGSVRVKAIALIPLGLLLLVTAARAQATGDAAKELREQMRKNLEVVTQLLVEMSAREYARALQRVDKLREHAAELKDRLSGRPSLFHSYAYALGQRAENLIASLEALEFNGRLPPETRRSDLEFLHDIAAADFGELISTCVACHGRYRPQRSKE